jgi:hypothetical protein
MWRPTGRTIELNMPAEIKPTDVLYYYDGPCIFTATLGLSEYLFHKMDETEDEQLFLVVPTSQKLVAALKSGLLSVWGAINQERLWAIEVDEALRIKRTWAVSIDDLPRELLPRAGLGLKPFPYVLADAIEQVGSFFSVKFTGASLKRGAMPLSTLKILVDGVYDSLRKIFPAPVVEQKSLSRYLDFNVLQPRFSSLVIAIERPYVNLSALRKEVRDKIVPDAFNDIFEENRKSFFTNVHTVLVEAKKGEIKRGFAIEHFETLEQISSMVPSESRNIDVVEFRYGEAQTTKSISINEELGVRIKGAHRLAELSNKGVQGTIIEVNSASWTFVIEGPGRRQITCVLSFDAFMKFHPELGQRVRVHGKYTQRSRRDLIDVVGDPELVKTR